MYLLLPNHWKKFPGKEYNGLQVKKEEKLWNIQRETEELNRSNFNGKIKAHCFLEMQTNQKSQNHCKKCQKG